MKIILTQTVPKLGKAGTVANVADGYARNYLFPRGLAIVAEKKQVEALEKRLARVAAKTEDLRASAVASAETLNGQTVRIPGQVGAAAGKLFGAITAQNIADAIKSQLGYAIDRKNVALIDPIKRLGTFSVELDLHRDATANINVEVFDPAAPAPKAAVVEPVEA